MRVLFVIIEAGGNVPPQLGIAKGLVQRGHDVRILGDAAIEEGVRAAGASFSPFRHAPHHDMRQKATDRVRDWEPNGYERLMEQVFFGPAEKYARDVVDEGVRFGPHCIGIDNLVLGGLVGAERTGLPTALLMHTICTLPLEGVPPVGLGLRPGRGRLGRLRDRILHRRGAAALDRGLPVLNAARQALGLSPIDHVTDQYARVDRALVLTSQAFDLPARRLPAFVRYVGPELEDPTWAEPWASPWPEDHADPLVVVAMGSTFQDQGEVTANVVRALSSMPVRGLVTLGGVFEPGDFPVSSNVVVVRSAPHAAVLPRASAVVTHGGHGTVMKALSHGLPLVCVPLGRDQADIGVRIEVAGAGLVVRRSADHAAIQAAIRRVLEEPSFRSSARRMASAIARDVEAKAATIELEALGAREA